MWSFGSFCYKAVEKRHKEHGRKTNRNKNEVSYWTIGKIILIFIVVSATVRTKRETRFKQLQSYIPPTIQVQRTRRMKCKRTFQSIGGSGDVPYGSQFFRFDTADLQKSAALGVGRLPPEAKSWIRH